MCPTDMTANGTGAFGADLTMEMELKLLLDPSGREAVESHPAFATARREARARQVTTYFDTADQAFLRQRASLRVRERGATFIQTVKVERRDDALGLRSEWEWPVESARVEVDALAALPESLGALWDAAGRAEPVFRSEIDRDTWHIRLAGGTEVEAVIDEGVLRTDRRSTPICEVELEHKGGPLGPLFGLAIELIERAPLRYGARSKAERGYGLIDGPPLAAEEVEWAAHGLDPSTTLTEAFPRLLAAATREFAAEIAHALSGDVEGVHRMRASIRKLRTLFVLFAPYIDREAAKRFNATLQEVGRVLGRRRDWDVLLTETLPEAREKLPTVELLVASAEEARRQAHAAVAALLDGPLPTRLILGLGAWTATPEWSIGDTSAEKSLHDVLPALLDRLARRVRKRSRHLGSLEAEELHALRKAMKKLRYSSEDVAALYPAAAGRRYLKTVKAVLKSLGEINDASVTRDRIDDIVTADRPELGAAAAALAEFADARRHDARDKLKHRMEEFRHAKRFWR